MPVSALVTRNNDPGGGIGLNRTVSWVTLVVVLLVAGVVVYPEINPGIVGEVRLRTNSRNYYADYPRLDQLDGPSLDGLFQLDTDWLLYVEEADILAVTNGEAGVYKGRPRVAGALRRTLNRLISAYQDGKPQSLLPSLAVSETGEEVILYLSRVGTKPYVNIRRLGLTYNNNALFPRFSQTSRFDFSDDRFPGVFDLREDYVPHRP